MFGERCSIDIRHCNNQVFSLSAGTLMSLRQVGATIQPTMDDDVRKNDRERDALQIAPASRWKRFSLQELRLVEGSNDMVGHIVARYGVDEVRARRDVDALLNGRVLSALSR